MPNSAAFDLIAVVDFSAAASVGPAKPTKDRSWLATARKGVMSEAMYFRTRLALLDYLSSLLADFQGNALIAWDFPFGYPVGSGLGGGRRIAARLHDLVEDKADGSNNRFEVAARLNRQFGAGQGPFWGRPASLSMKDVDARKGSYDGFGFKEWRVVERMARAAGHHHLQSVWKLYTTGSVGSQALMGLALIERLNGLLSGNNNIRYWPFETDWDQSLQGIVHAECWPSLFPFQSVDHPIRDAQQVIATCDLLEQANQMGAIRELLSCPEGLSGADRRAVEQEEGWILGFTPT